MKKLVALTLAAVMTVSVLTACGSKETAGSSTPAEGTEADASKEGHDVSKEEAEPEAQ